MLDWSSLNRFLSISKHLNREYSLPILSIACLSSIRLINTHNWSFLIRKENDLILVMEFSWILNNSPNMFSLLHMIHCFVIINTNMSYILYGWIVVISLSHNKVLVILKLYFWVSIVLMFFRNLSQHINFLFMVRVVWINKHVLIVLGNMVELHNFNILILSFV